MSLRGFFRAFVDNKKNDPSEFNPKRTCGETPLAACGGSITVEAAVAVSLFLIAFATFLSLFGVLQNQIKRIYELDKTLQKAAVYISVLNDIDEYEEGALSDIDLTIADEGIKIEGDDIYARIPHYDRALFVSSLTGGFLTNDTLCRRIWSGRLLTDGDEDEHEDEIYVYVAENGIVYHRFESCTHLKLSVSEVSRSSLPGMRNSSGGKYYPCEKCGGGTEDTVLITADGTRYHSDRECSGLKRTYTKVKLSETSLPPCSRCGG